MSAQLQERVDKLEATIEALRDQDIVLTRWNRARAEEIIKHQNKIDDLTKRLELLGETVSNHTDARLSGLEATTTIYDAWSSGVNDTLQKVIDRLDELEASRPAINTYDDHFKKRQALYSPEMYIVLEMVEKAATVQEWYAVREALNNVLRKIRQGNDNPSDNAHRGEDGSND